MRNTAKNKGKPCYILLIKANNMVYLSTTKKYIADKLGIHSATITRNMLKSNCYITEEYIIWKNVPLHKGRATYHPKSFKSTDYY